MAHRYVSIGGGASAAATAWSFVYVPFSTEGAVVGHVDPDGSFLRGSGDFTITWDATTSRYHLEIEGRDNLHEGVLLINACNTVVTNNTSTAASHSQWDVNPTGEIDIYSYDLPLTTGGLSQTGFVFAFIPYDGLVTEPGR